MRALFIAVAIVIVGACASAPRVSVSSRVGPEELRGTELVARVKTALLNDPVVGVRRIDVHVSNDEVRLTGRVASTAERDRAVLIVSGVPGVRNVISDLEIRP